MGSVGVKLIRDLTICQTHYLRAKVHKVVKLAWVLMTILSPCNIPSQSLWPQSHPFQYSLALATKLLTGEGDSAEVSHKFGIHQNRKVILCVHWPAFTCTISWKGAGLAVNILSIDRGLRPFRPLGEYYKVALWGQSVGGSFRPRRRQGNARAR